MDLIRLDANQWQDYAENAHLVCFNEKRPAEMDRIDYALMTVKDGQPQSYCTVRDLDSESGYWQYGGSFPSAKDTINSMKSYTMFRDYMEANGYKRVSTYVKNDNIVMLKMAFKVGYRIIGTRTFKNEIYVELLNEFDKE